MDISLDGVRLICRDPVVVGEDVLLTFQIKCQGGVQIETVSSRVIFVMDDEALGGGLEVQRRSGSADHAASGASRGERRLATVERNGVLALLNVNFDRFVEVIAA